MGTSKIDTIIQHKLLTHKTGLNKESLWAAIESDVVTNDKAIFFPSTKANSSSDIPSNSILRILLLLLLAAAVGVSGMYLFSGGEMVDAQAHSNVDQQVAKSSVITNENPQPEHNNSLVAPVTLDEKETTNAMPQLSEQPPQIKHTATVVPASTLTIPVNKTQTITAQKVVTAQVTQTSITPPLTDDQPIVNTSDSYVKSSSQLTHFASDKSYKVKQNIPSARINSLYQLGLNTLNPLNYKQTTVTISNDYMASMKDKISCYSYGPSKLKISGLLYYGPGASLRSLKSNNVEMNTLVEERENSEVVLENHRAGLQLKATTDSGIYFKVGLERSIINEKFQQFSMDTTMEIRQVVVEIIEYPDGSTDEILGDQLVTIISRKEWKKYNQFKTFDLTAIVGYEATVRKWRYAVEGGIIYNFSTQFDGTILDDVSLMPTDDTRQLFKSETGVDLHLAGGLGYDVSPSMTLWAMPSIRFDLKDINQASYKVDQSYQMANLLLGLEYRF